MEHLSAVDRACDVPIEVNLSAAKDFRPYRELFLISFVILFLELACIRWFGSTVIFLTFFTNIVLLATFLGMSVGCLAAAHRRNLVGTVIPLLLLAVVLAAGVLYVYLRFGTVMIDVGGRGSPQQVYFGTEYRARDVSRFVVPIEAVAGVFFLVISLAFVGLGQVMGRTFNQAPNRIAAYTANIAGSLAGIVAFAAASYLRTSPIIWFSVALALCVPFVKRWTPLQTYALIGVLALVTLAAYAGRSLTVWSPYYKIRYSPLNGFVSTNNIGHQQMVDLAREGPGYVLPHLLNRDSGGRPFEDVLVIGAGSGNDVEAALRYGARHVDAVEIDPAIYELGREDHPNHPYASPRVTVHIDDGRSFVRQTSRQYDLVVYALVDSLVLHSGYSSLRLESFLFTKEAFQDIKGRLKPGGVFAVYNLFRQGWMVGRLNQMAREVFGAEPLTLSLPYVARIVPEDQRNRITFVLVGSDAPALARIRQRLERGLFWVNNAPARNESVNGFDFQPPAGAAPAASWSPIGLAKVELRKREPLPSDDWPFLYLRDAVVPALNIRGILLIAALSLAVLYLFAPGGRVHPNWQTFFLGAGFMLLETKGVVHMALLFGSTWMVNSIVIFAILVMILCSNLFVWLVKPKRLWLYYLLLVTALAMDIVFPMSTFLGLPGSEKVILSCAVVFIPIFFAGIIFAAVFRTSAQPDMDFGSNIAGSILGGLSEALALMVGFQYLLLVGILFYLLSALLRSRGGVTLQAAAS